MAGLLDSIMPAFLAPTKPETPYSGNNGLFGLFGDGTAGRLGLAGATIGNLAVGKPFDTSSGLMALNEKELSRKELERKYKAAMRYADKIQESNPEYADQIRTDWTLANFIQQEKLKNDLDPVKGPQAAKLEAEANMLNQRNALLQQYMDPGVAAAGAPGTPPAGAVGTTSPLPAAAGGGATPAMIGGTPDTPMPPAPAPAPAPQQQSSNPFMDRYKRMTGLEDLRPDEAEYIKRAELAALLDNENDFSKVNTAVKQVVEARQNETKFEQEQADRLASKANRDRKLAALENSGFYNADQMAAFAGNDEMLNKTFEEFTTRNSDPDYGRTVELAKMLKGVDDNTARVLAADKNMVANLVQKQIENAQNPNSDSALKSRILGGEVNIKHQAGKPPKVEVPTFDATKEQRARIAYEFGLGPISATTAKRIMNSPDGIAAEAGKVRDEQRKDTETKTDRSLKLNEQYNKAKAKNQEIKNLAIDIAQQMATGNLTQEALTKSPEKGMSILYKYIKVLDPDSAVREGEMALARQMETYLQYFNNEMAKAGVKFDKNGEPINPHVVPPQVVQSMAQEIISMGSDADRRLEDIEADYADLAANVGADVRTVIGRPHEDTNFDSSSPEFFKQHADKVPQNITVKRAEEARQQYTRENGPQSGVPALDNWGESE